MLDLFKAILDHDTASAVTLIEQVRVCHVSWGGCNALQIAAREGQQEIVLQLLREGVRVDQVGTHQKTAFYYAIEYGHTLTARILLACGANREEAVLLAKQFKQEELIQEIVCLDVDAATVRNIFLWAGREDHIYNTGFYELVTSVSLLSGDEKGAVLELIRGWYALSSRLRSLFGDEYYSHPQMTSLVTALPSLEHFTYAEYKKYSEVAILVFAGNDFVALNELRKKLDKIDREVLLDIFLSERQYALALSWLMCSGIDLASFLLKFPQENEVIDQAALWEKREGIAHTLISSKVNFSGFVSKELCQLLLVLGQTREQTAQKLQRALQIRSHLPVFSLTFDQLGYIHIPQQLSHLELAAITTYYARFRFGIKLATNKNAHNQLPSDIWTYGIISYLTMRERLNLFHVSHLHREALNRSSSQEQQLLQLDAEIACLTQFIALADKYVDRMKSINDAINLCCRVVAMLLVAAAVVVITVGVFFLCNADVDAVSSAFGVLVLGAVEVIENVYKWTNSRNWFSMSLNSSSYSVKEAANDLFANLASTPDARHYSVFSTVNGLAYAAQNLIFNKMNERTILKAELDKKKLIRNDGSEQRKVVSYTSNLPRLGLFAINEEQKAENPPSQAAQMRLWPPM
jgi:hypothetical protein